MKELKGESWFYSPLYVHLKYFLTEKEIRNFLYILACEEQIRFNWKLLNLGLRLKPEIRRSYSKGYRSLELHTHKHAHTSMRTKGKKMGKRKRKSKSCKAHYSDMLVIVRPELDFERMRVDTILIFRWLLLWIKPAALENINTYRIV